VMFPDGQVALSSVTMTGMPALGGSRPTTRARDWRPKWLN
jgi:hypothetical protein